MKTHNTLSATTIVTSVAANIIEHSAEIAGVIAILVGLTSLALNIIKIKNEHKNQKK